MTDDELIALSARIAKGKAYIELNGGFSSNSHMRTAIDLWWKLSDGYFKELKRRSQGTVPPKVKHSKAWHDMKFREAFDKWSKTYPKATRGTDPRTLPRESFV